jgi:hypothetical protein
MTAPTAGKAGSTLQQAGWHRRERLLVVALATVVTMGLQPWIGGLTIYSDETRSSREVLHRAILHNQPPPGRTWSDLGANGVNVRVAAVFLAEALSGPLKSVRRAYIAMDTVGLWCGLLLLAGYLRRWFRFELALIGLLYFAVCLPLTYLFHYFHPWDRLSLVTWLSLLLALRRDRRAALALLLPVAITVKYDAVPFGLLYAATYWTRGQRAAVLIGGALLIEGALTFVLLLMAFPGGFAERPVATLLADNLRVLWQEGPTYPPLLVFGPVLAMAVVGWREAPTDIRAAAAFALLLAVLLFFQVHFVEVRALMPILVMMLPAGLVGLRRFMPGADVPPPDSLLGS